MLDTKKKEDRMCKSVIRSAGMKQDDIARVFNVSQSVVSRPLKEHRVEVYLENINLILAFIINIISQLIELLNISTAFIV